MLYNDVFFFGKPLQVEVSLQQWSAAIWISLEPLKLILEVELKVDRTHYIQSQQSRAVKGHYLSLCGAYNL